MLLLDVVLNDANDANVSSTDICIAASLRIPRELNNDTFFRILQDLRKQTHARARAVVMFVNEDNVRKLLTAAINHKVRCKKMDISFRGSWVV